MILDAGVPGGRARAPFYAMVFVDHVVIHPDGTDQVLRTVHGYTFTNTGTYDAQHMEFASVVASVPMSDGSTFSVDLAWSADDARQVYGSNGLHSEEVGLPAAHFRTPCLTANYLDHQKFQHAVASGTLNGVPTSEYGNQGEFLLNNWFHWTEVVHGNCWVILLAASRSEPPS